MFTNWLTPSPTLLFLLLNLVIATIALLSKLTNKNIHPNIPKIASSPSLLLHRLKSINFYPHHYTYYQEQPQKSNLDQETENPQAQTPPPEVNDKTLDGLNPPADSDDVPGNELLSMDEIYSRLKGIKFNRSISDSKSSAILRTASFRRAEKGKVTTVEARRPATMREGRRGDAEVDTKADDFINRFRQQLKLQRLESITRYKDKIRRGILGR